MATPAPVSCPRCGGAVPRQAIRVEEDRASCPFCAHAFSLAAAAASGPGRAAPEGLPCPRCGGAVPVPPTEYLEGLVRCGHCATVLDLSSGRNAGWYRSRMSEKEGIALPPTLRVTRSMGTVTLEWLAFRHRLRQYTRVAGSGGLFRRVLLAALFVLVVGTVAAIVVPDIRIGNRVAAGWAVLLLPLLPMMVLRRRVSVAGGTVRIGWGPLLPGFRAVPRSEITQLFVVPRSVDVHDGVGTPEVDRLLAWDLMALAPDGSRARLLGPLAERDEALFLERWLERRLGIGERRVDGELLLEGAGPHA